ncbi:MAG: alpha/beta hydrolase-fold protein, partial [FCB group bacterium]
MKKYYLFLVISFIFLLSAIQSSFSVQTGSYNVTVLFQGANRKISVYVPDNYDSTQRFNLMICLHGDGDNSISYRDALVSFINGLNILNNTILVCPDGGDDRARDFYTPSGDEQFITIAYNYAISNFFIDPTKIILQGFSLGARCALKYGLDNSDKFS